MSHRILISHNVQLGKMSNVKMCLSIGEQNKSDLHENLWGKSLGKLHTHMRSFLPTRIVYFPKYKMHLFCKHFAGASYIHKVSCDLERPECPYFACNPAKLHVTAFVKNCDLRCRPIAVKAAQRPWRY